MTRRSVRPSWSAHVTVAALAPCISTASTSTGPDTARPDTYVPGVRALKSLIGCGVVGITQCTTVLTVGTKAAKTPRTGRPPWAAAAERYLSRQGRRPVEDRLQGECHEGRRWNPALLGAKVQQLGARRLVSGTRA